MVQLLREAHIGSARPRHLRPHAPGRLVHAKGPGRHRGGPLVAGPGGRGPGADGPGARRARARWVLARAEVIRSKRESGKSYREIAADGEPLIITRVTENLQNLVNAGSRLRRAHARALYAEGATLQEIGKLFGVSHQRISAIIHSSDEDAPGRGRPRRGR